MSEQKYKRFTCQTRIKRYGKVHQPGDEIQIEADAEDEIAHLMDTKAISEPEKKTGGGGRQASRAQADTES